MTISLIISALILISIFALFSRKRKEKADEENDSDDDFEETGENNIEEKFFHEVRNGKEKCKFLKIDNTFDLMFIKSLFQSENIPYYVEFENTSRMRPGMYVGDLGNYNLLYILDEDYNDAIKVVKKYIATKKKNNNKNVSENIRNVSEILIGNWKVPSATDTNGIEIIYKSKRKL